MRHFPVAGLVAAAGALQRLGETLAVREASIQRPAGVLDFPNFQELQEDDRRRALLDWLRLHPGWFLVINSRD